MSSPHKRPRYELVARTGRPDGSGETKVIDVAGVRFGGAPVVIAGPCAVESREQLLAVAHAAKKAGAAMLRGGAYKTRTSPYDFQGMGDAALPLLAEARTATGLPLVTEVLDASQIPGVADVADMLQVGTRNMHNTPLLKAIGRSGKPVLLKRGWASTLTEWLCAAEYIALEGNDQIVLCERGIRTDPRSGHPSPILDFDAVTALRGLTWLPVLLDPSHGTEDAAAVPGACARALKAGAHGLIVEVLPPGASCDAVRCDGHQSITPEVLEQIVRDASI